jgi:hypothetical protein
MNHFYISEKSFFLFDQKISCAILCSNSQTLAWLSPSYIKFTIGCSCRLIGDSIYEVTTNQHALSGVVIIPTVLDIFFVNKYFGNDHV